MDHIRKMVQRSGNPVWQVNGRKFGFGRPQFATTELAEAALADMIKKRGGGLSPGRRDVRFAEQAEAFLAHASDGLAEKTLRSYRGHLKVHILPRFGERRVVEINTAMIKSFLTEKRQPIPTCKIVSADPKKARVIDAADFDAATMKKWPEQDAGATRKLSTSTVRLIRATLSVVFQSAVDDRIISENPVAAARSSRRSRKARAANRDAVTKERVFTEAQQSAILSWCSERDRELHDLFFLLLRSGLRPGECRALGWGDIDFTKRKIRVDFSVTDKDTFGPTKTGEPRSVDMSPAVADVLRVRQLKRTRAGSRRSGRGHGGVGILESLGHATRRFPIAKAFRSCDGRDGDNRARPLRCAAHLCFHAPSTLPRLRLRRRADGARQPQDHDGSLRPPVAGRRSELRRLARRVGSRLAAIWLRWPRGPDKAPGDCKNPRFYLRFPLTDSSGDDSASVASGSSSSASDRPVT